MNTINMVKKKKERTRKEIREDLADSLCQYQFLEYHIQGLVEELKKKAKRLSAEEKELLNDAEYIGW